MHRWKKYRKILLLVISVGSNAVLVLAPQLISLILLNPNYFGIFSVVYLVYAFSVSLSLSIVSEPLVRSGIPASNMNAQRGYLSTLAAVSILAGLVGGVVSFGFHLGLLMSVVSFLAVTLGSFRAGLRFYLVYLNDTRSVLVGDLLGILGFVSTLVFLPMNYGGALVSIVLAWAMSSFLSIMPNYRLLIGSPRHVVSWINENKTDIRHLLKDSLLMDVGSIFTPLIIAPYLGNSGFGTYRAVSNVAAPVRLVLNPLRPLIGNHAKRHLASYRFYILAGTFVGLLFGAAAAAALLLLDHLQIQIGTMNSLVDYKIPVSLFIFSNFLGHLFYIRARAVSSGHELFKGRIIQTIFMTIGPIAGVTLFGLPGAIWFLSVVTLLSSVSWIYIGRKIF